MPSKKELQEQIDKLKQDIVVLFKINKERSFQMYSKQDKKYLFTIDHRLLSDTKYSKFGIFDGGYIDIEELRKQFLALLDYLKLEYIVEDKHLEGFKKK